MFYHLKIAFRNLRRNGLYSTINITGLTISLAACILMIIWVYDELSYDRFHANKENIYLVNTVLNSADGNNYSYRYSSAGLSVYAKAEVPEIKDACRFSEHSFSYFRYNSRQILTNNSITRGAAVDSSFFKIFSFPLINGNPQKPFDGDFSIVLSESTAKSIFGDENPIGKAIMTNWGDEYFHVTGIMKDMPENSSIQYDYLIPFNLMKRTYSAFGPFKEPDEDMVRFNYTTYLELYPGSNVKQVGDKLREIAVRVTTPYASFLGFTEFPPIQFPLQQMTGQHLYNADGSPGGIVKVRLFAVISILILVIACINYVNLVTARTGKRSKEMGVRKFLGAKWANIVRQSMQETCLMLAIALVLATMLIYLLLPAYNQISGKSMEFHLFSPHVLIIYGIAIICILGLAGIYPSLYLASFGSSKPVGNKNKHTSLRKTLVVLQFVCSVALIVSTLVITLQMNFIREKDLGYDKENIICFAAWSMGEHIDAVRNELQKNPDVSGVSTASFRNMLNHDFEFGVSWQGREKAMKFNFGRVDFDFLEVMNIQIVEGQMPPETSGGKYCLLNETAVREMQLKDPVGQTINCPSYQDNQAITISGVIRDFNFESLNQQVSPQILCCTKNNPGFFYVKTTTQGTQSVLGSIEKIWKQYCPDLLFDYSFLDDNFERVYKTDIRMGQLLYIFAFIAIIISCLGLFGLITYTAETKTKEIGIRKVLGASIGDIVNMLSKEFLVLVGIAMLIAFPLAYYWLEKMLQDYAYHITIGWWIFALAGIVTVVLTVLTVGWQAIKAATANPVKSIKAE